MSSRKLSFSNPPASQSDPSSNLASTDLQQDRNAAAEVPDVSIVDDDEYDRLSTERILMRSVGFRLDRSYATASEALVALAISTPHIVLMDIRMPDMSGIELTRRLKSLLPSLIIVIVTGLDDTQSIDQALNAGSDDYLIKPFTASQLLAMLTFCFSRRELKPTGARQEGKSSTEGWPLSVRQRAVADLVSKGCRNKEIAEQLKLSVRIVENQVISIRRKLNASNRAQVASRLR